MLPWRSGPSQGSRSHPSKEDEAGSHGHKDKAHISPRHVDPQTGEHTLYLKGYDNEQQPARVKKAPIRSIKEAPSEPPTTAFSGAEGSYRISLSLFKGGTVPVP